MVMPAGATLRTIGRMAGRHFRDQAQLQRWSGKVDEIDTYEDQGLFNCKLMESSGVVYGLDNAAQNYSTTVILMGGIPPSEPDDRYRVKVTQFKSPAESDSAEPEVKRTRYLDVEAVQAKTDLAGTDSLTVLRCKNGEAW